MKKLFYLLFFAAGLTACENEDLEMKDTPSQEPTIQLVKLTHDGNIMNVSSTTRANEDGSTYVLKFSSNDVLKSVTRNLKNLTSEERISYIKKVGFNSLQELSQEADKELEQIGEEATSESDFESKYQDYVEKYKGLLITNSTDMSDLSLYVPDGDNILTYLINGMKTIVVGDSIKRIDISEKMSPSDLRAYTDYSVMPLTTTDYSDNWYNNGCTVVYKSGKKLNIELTISDIVDYKMNVHIGAQKKMWYGWKRDSAREFYYESNLNNFEYLMFFNDHICPAPHAERYCHKGDGKLDVILGKKHGVSTDFINGTMLFWTDLISEKDANGNQIYEKKKVLAAPGLIEDNVPKCISSKAFHIKVSLNK